MSIAGLKKDQINVVYVSINVLCPHKKMPISYNYWAKGGVKEQKNMKSLHLEYLMALLDHIEFTAPSKELI